MSTPSLAIESTKLLQPFKLSNMHLQHRIVMAPMTRMRASKAHVHGDLALKYYTQRSSTPGTLLISEATLISPESGGYPNIPGIWNDAQVAAWEKITKAVHANGSYIFCQLAASGCAAIPSVLEHEEGGPYETVSAGDIGIADHAKPRPLTLEEIDTYKNKFVIAAKNAIAAGFDGIELHNANGYLMDQFLQDVSNNRTDQYGGSIENRARFSLEVIDAIAAAIGAERIAIRISPWNPAREMRMKDPIPQFSYLVEQLKARHPTLAYLHVVESRVPGFSNFEAVGGSIEPDSTHTDDLGRPQSTSNDFLRAIWQPRPYISAGGYSEATGVELALRAAEHDVFVAFGRSFQANPDLPLRIRKGIRLAVADGTTAYSIEEAHGYVDYPFADEAQDALKVVAT